MAVRPWEILASRQQDHLRIFGLRIDRAVSPRTGRDHEFYILESRSWVNVIPLTPDEQVVLVRQYRHGTREVTLEIPGGIVDPGDRPEEAARRELKEETGYAAGEIHALGFVHPNPAFLDNRCFSFVARGCLPVGRQQQDEKEDIEVALRPLAEIPAMIRNGEITHSLVIAAFYRFYMEFSAPSGRQPGREP
jgi:8-oxo-dGTP pyrophosphatase MutT (NUDIX family)